MDYLNRCLLLERYRSTIIFDDNVSYFVIAINDENGLIIRVEKISFLSHKERAD